MSLAPRRHMALLMAAGGAVAIAFAPCAAADPDIDGQSAAAVIVELQEEGYVVVVNGVSSGDTGLLTSCKVTHVHHPGDSAPDPTTATVYVDVACPISHG